MNRKSSFQFGINKNNDSDNSTKIGNGDDAVEKIRKNINQAYYNPVFVSIFHTTLFSPIKCFTRTPSINKI